MPCELSRWATGESLRSDPECDGERLARELEALLTDTDRLRAMGEAARRHAHPEAAARIAELVDAHAR